MYLLSLRKELLCILMQLKRKTGELTKACEKHYELEQELAFYKIDHKFDQLGKIPSPDTEVRSLPSFKLHLCSQ